MGGCKIKSQRPAKVGSSLPAKALAVELDRIASMSIQELRAFWQSKYGQKPPEALTKDLIARALCQRLQEEALGGLGKKLEQQLLRAAAKGIVPSKQFKIGSTILREHQGQMHEVVWSRAVFSGRHRPTRAFLPLPGRLQARAGTA